MEDDQPSALKLKLQNLLSDATSHSHLLLELAITIDAGEPFIKATYTLEGDGPLALLCYRVLALALPIPTTNEWQSKKEQTGLFYFSKQACFWGF